MRFDTVLVANRGEIACRVLRTAHDLGYRTVAVYSEADAEAPHVELADAAVCLGPAPPSESYLDLERVLAAATSSGAGAIHPGYGFLSENAAFASACEDAGIVFVGPSAEAIDAMGNKAEAKRRMLAADVPCVPGYEGEDQSTSALLAHAEEIGFPLMVKAAAGGGGRGMRLVHGLEETESALEIARAEAESAFGSGELILEKAVTSARHVEVQVFGDLHGNVVHFGERDCSVQRRHQKVLEEAPCPVLAAELRARMGAAAVAAAEAIGYYGAGTVEFLLDSEGTFYFLEMNTRIQVEHPVTEMVTATDLVALQFHVAQGHPLPLSQDEVRLSGHAIEARLYAEDPAQGFLPQSGHIHRFEPAVGEGVRVDAGIRSGHDVSPFYDPMLAKVIAWGPNRDAALRRLAAALEGTRLFGPATNRDFLLRCLHHPEFAEGRATTRFLDEAAELTSPPSEAAESSWDLRCAQRFAAAGALLLAQQREQALAQTVLVAPALCNWSSAEGLGTRYSLESGDSAARVVVCPARAGDDPARAAFDVVVEPRGDEGAGGEAEAFAVRIVISAREAGDTVLQVDGAPVPVHVLSQARGEISVRFVGRGSEVGETLHFVDTLGRGADSLAQQSEGVVASPMHGRVIRTLVAVGDSVQKGQTVAILEAMKMQHEIEVRAAGTVAAVRADEGDQVAAGDVLLEVDV